jgi:hypothetical protein
VETLKLWQTFKTLSPSMSPSMTSPVNCLTLYSFGNFLSVTKCILRRLQFRALLQPCRPPAPLLQRHQQQHQQSLLCPLSQGQTHNFRRHQPRRRGRRAPGLHPCPCLHRRALAPLVGGLIVNNTESEGRIRGHRERERARVLGRLQECEGGL